MENKGKGILVSDTQLVDILDKYEYLMFNLNTQIAPTISKMIELQKELQDLDAIFNKTEKIAKDLNSIHLKIENSTDIILKKKIEENVKSKILEHNKKIGEENKKSLKKELIVISLLGGICIGFILASVFNFISK